MRKVIVTNISTLDGFYAGPGNDPMVLNMDAAFDAYNLQRLRSAAVVLLGRSSFELFSSFWPSVADAPADPSNPTLSDGNRELSRRYLTVPKVVVSDTLSVPSSNPWQSSTEVVGRNAAAGRIRALKDSAIDSDRDIVIFGSHLLWNALLAEGLVDELHLIIGPDAIGAGVSLFQAPIRLTLLEAARLDGSENVLHRYAYKS